MLFNLCLVFVHKIETIEYGKNSLFFKKHASTSVENNLIIFRIGSVEFSGHYFHMNTNFNSI